MKKIYLNPTLDVVEIDVKNQILAGSIGDVEGGSNDGAINTGSGGNPTDPDFGSDY